MVAELLLTTYEVLGKVVFSQASVCSQGVCGIEGVSMQGVSAQGAVGMCLPGGSTPSPEMATAVVGMHPTAMHSYFPRTGH